jgi:hypothetical protein
VYFGGCGVVKGGDLFHNGWVRAFRTEGIIIKRRNFGEADRILTVFTRDHGKLHIKASGVRKITSRRSGQIELLNQAVLGLYKGNGFPILTEAKMLNDFADLKMDLDKIGFAYHLCELVDGLCPEDQEQRAVYELLRETLGKLSMSTIEPRGEIPPTPLYQGGKPESPSRFGLSSRSKDLLDKGGGPQAGGFASGDIAVIIHEFEVELLSLLGYWNSETQSPALLRDAPAYIETIIERKLKSRKIFAKLQ